jgi:hypothetical protein
MTLYLGYSLQQRQPQTPRDGNHAGEFQKDRVWSIERSIGEEYGLQLFADGLHLFFPRRPDLQNKAAQLARTFSPLPAVSVSP